MKRLKIYSIWLCLFFSAGSSFAEALHVEIKNSLKHPMTIATPWPKDPGLSCKLNDNFNNDPIAVDKSITAFSIESKCGDGKQQVIYQAVYNVINDKNMKGTCKFTITGFPDPGDASNDSKWANITYETICPNMEGIYIVTKKEESKINFNVDDVPPSDD